MRVAASHHASPGGVADRRLAMPIGKKGAHPGEAVDVGGFRLGEPAEATDPIIQIVDRDQQDVWLILGSEGKAWDGEEDGEQKTGWFHG